MENHHFEWENPLFLWPFSIAMLNYQRVYHHICWLLQAWSCYKHQAFQHCRNIAEPAALLGSWAIRRRPGTAWNKRVPWCLFGYKNHQQTPWFPGKNIWTYHRIGRWENFNRKALYLMVKTMVVSCRFSLKPIHWTYESTNGKIWIYQWENMNLPMAG